MKILMLAVLLSGCGMTEASRRERHDAGMWVLTTMTRENWRCFVEWRATDRSAADEWLGGAVAAKIEHDDTGSAAALASSLDALEIHCGTSWFKVNEPRGRK